MLNIPFGCCFLFLKNRTAQIIKQEFIPVKFLCNFRLNKVIMENTLNELQHQISVRPETCYFEKPASLAEINELETYLRLCLPDSYKRFLLRYNGGFIVNPVLISKSKPSLETLKWNCHLLLGIHEIVAAYDRIDYKFYNSNYRFIPFCHTDNQELLDFRALPNPYTDSAVYDAWHEVGPQQWLEQEIYPDFGAFLKAYIDKPYELRLIG